MSLLANNLKRIREERGITMKDLARLSELSTAQISKLENGKADPSVSSLMRLSEVLNVSAATLLAEDTPRVSPLRKGEGYPFRRYTNNKEPVLETFLNTHKNDRMQAEIILIPPETDSGPMLSHNGDEFFYILEGSVEFRYGTESFDMSEGDFLYYDNTIPHGWVNKSGKSLKLLVCTSPPVF